MSQTMNERKKFRMVIEPMPGNFSTRNYPQKTGLWKVVMCETDKWGSVIQDSPENQVQIANVDYDYDNAMIDCCRLQKELEHAERMKARR